MAIGIQSDGSVLETTVSVKSGRKKLYDNKERVKGFIVGKAKAGLYVKIMGTNAFLPLSQIDVRPVRDVSHLIKTEETFEILIGVYGFDPSEFDIQNNVKIYRVIYESLGAKGEPTQLSGAIYVPQLNTKKAMPTLKISHYTITQRDAVASVSPNVSPQSILGSMQGYFAIYSDGIGYGVSVTQASYVNKQASAISGIDLLRASKEFALSLIHI